MAFILSVFFILSASLTYYLTLYFQSTSYTILDHSYQFSSLLFFPLWAAFFFLLSFSWIILTLMDIRVFKADRNSSLWGNFLNYPPFFFFLLTPLLLQHYLNKNDLRLRLNTLAFLIFLCFLYLKVVQLNQHFKDKSLFEKWADRFNTLSLKKRLVILFVLAFAIYNICTFILVSKGITFSGDEPYYLLTTHSLNQDKDINVANNYANEDYFHFYSREQNPRLKLGRYARAGRKGRDYLYPINLSGLSVLILPRYWLSQHFSGKTLTLLLKGGLSIWAALLGLQLYLFIKDLGRKEGLSLSLWIFYSFTSPVLFYAIHIYPEIPIALFSFYIFRKVRSRNILSLSHYLFLGFLISLFLWFGLKYSLIFWPLLLVSVYFLLKEHKARFKIFIFLFPSILSLVLFYLYLYNLYGSFYPFSIYEGVMTPERLNAFRQMMLKIPVMLRIDTFFDFFLDQRDGLLLYSPLYFFSLLGVIEAFRKSKKELFTLLFISLPYVLNYAFFTHRQGYSPQGRVLTNISWVGAILIGYFLVYNRKKIYAFLFWFACSISLGMVFLLLQHPSFLYQPTTHEFTFRPGALFVSLSNIYFFLPNLLPSFIKINNLGYIPNFIWILALIAFCLLYVFLKKDIPLKRNFHFSFSLSLLLILVMLWVLYPRTILYPARTLRYSPQKALGLYLSPLGEGVVIKEMGELYLHREGSYRVLFSSRTKIENIKLNFGSEKGKFEAKFSFFDIPLWEGKTSYERKEFILTPQIYYPFKKLFLYEILIDLKKYSSESMLIDPYFFQILPLKNKN